MQISFTPQAESERISVNTTAAYDIIFANEDLFTRIDEQCSGADKCFVVTDENLARYQANFLTELTAGERVCGQFTMAAGESSKNWHNLQALLTAMLENGLSRASLLIAVGGGVVSDVAGLAAALYMRGIAFVIVPTSLLAMTDAAIGGKTGINHERGKNLIGAFHQPQAIIVAARFLQTLPQAELLAGLAEVIKYGYLFDDAFLEYLESRFDAFLALDEAMMDVVLRYSCQVKSVIVEADEKERGLRALLNFGHTFGHALERFYAYGQISHGQAVNLGMVLAWKFAHWQGLIEKAEIRWQLHRQIPVDKSFLRGWQAEQLAEIMEIDKKARADGIHLVLPGPAGMAVRGPYRVSVLRQFWQMQSKQLVEEWYD
jgi:3-dehydroquinate synthase